MNNELRVPALPESVADATVLNWHRQPGDTVKRDEVLVDLETDKVVLEVPATTDGVLSEIVTGDGATVQANDILGIITDNVPVTGSDIKAAPARQPSETPEQPAEEEPALSPSVRRLIREMKLDPSQISGSGPGGRIIKADVMNFLDSQESSRPERHPDAFEQATEEILRSPGPDARTEKRVPMTRLRKRIAERLVEAQQTAAMLTTFNEVNLQAIIDLRTRHRDAFEQKHGVRLGFMSFFVKASVEVLKQFPLVNASIDGDDVVYHGYYDIGIAVSSPRGLVVPVLRDCEQMGFAEIEQGIADYAAKAADSSLNIEELTGGTFTISNGGIFGSMLSTPILNPPQSAILGMHSIQQRPVAENGEVVIRPMMYLALSYDHRIIDGREAVQFLVAIKQFLEDPARLLLQV